MMPGKPPAGRTGTGYVEISYPRYDPDTGERSYPPGGGPDSFIAFHAEKESLFWQCLPYLMGFLTVIAIAGVIFLAAMADKEFPSSQSRLMSQCLADGRKEYECVGIIAGRAIPPPSALKREP